MAEATATPEIKQIKTELISPRAISKKNDPEGRTATAKAMVETREEKRTTKEGIKTGETKSKEVDEKLSESYRQEVIRRHELKDRLAQNLIKLKLKIGWGDKQSEQLQQEIDAIKTDSEGMYAQMRTLDQQVEDLQKKQEEIPDPKKLVEGYYAKVEVTPLTNEEKREKLTPELLASLSTEEYVALWKRLNPQFLSHVTRQGFRDHNAMVYHSAGLEAFHNGFLSILQDSKEIRPPLFLDGLQTRGDSAVRNFLEKNGVLDAKDEAQAKEYLATLLNHTLSSSPKYPDGTAVHLAPQIVMDEFYGGERGNDVFFLYPTDVLASQYKFAFGPEGWSGDFTKPNSDTKWNDVFVWPNNLDNPGISVDSGMVFLPESSSVDPTTGSKYASEIKTIDGVEKRVMVEDKRLMNAFSVWAKGLDEEAPVRKAFRVYKQTLNYNARQDSERVCLQVLNDEIVKLGFTPEASSEVSREFFSDMIDGAVFDDELIVAMLTKSGASWKRAENTIGSKDYWENYFNEHPDMRPKHVIYYDGKPTDAVFAFEQKNAIGAADTSVTEGKLLGFDDNRVENIRDDPEANRGYDELVQTAEKIISEKYVNTAKSEV